MYTYIPIAGEAEIDDNLGLSARYSYWISELSKFSERSFLKKYGRDQ